MFEYDINFKPNSPLEYQEELDKLNAAVDEINNDTFLSQQDKNLLMYDFNDLFIFKNPDGSTLISAVVLIYKDGKMRFRHGFWRGLKYYKEEEWWNATKNTINS